MIAKLGIVSIYGFLLGLPILFVLIPNTFPIYINYKEINVLYLFIVYAVLTHILVRIINRGIIYNICAQALLLGLTLAAGVMVCILAPTSWKPFGWYVCVMAIFHYSEFLSIAVCNPKTLSPSSFMLNHSVAYGIAAFASWIEYLLWYIFFPNLKTWHSISYIGIVMCTFGEVLRKTAIWTARNNFTHLVQNEKTQTHSLVTNGVYSWFRHPSYVGWFYWSIGTQWIMINPVCIIAYALASWKFFKERIYYEEMTLLNFFGENYVSYQKKVGIGLPFIKGFEIPNEN